MYRALWLESPTDSFSTTNVRDPRAHPATSPAVRSIAVCVTGSRLRRCDSSLDAVWLDKGRFLREAPNAPPTGNTTYVS